jgi:molecular chaperone GrpE
VRETDETIETQGTGTPEAAERVPHGAAPVEDGQARADSRDHDGAQLGDGARGARGAEATAGGEAATHDVGDDRVAGAQPSGGPGAASGAQQRSEEQDALQGDVDELLQALTERDEYLALAQRTQADFENYRKRVAREAAKGEQRGVAKLAKELLPALDNLDRAIEAAAEGDPLLEGVRLVRNELGAALSRLQIEHFSPIGERFDPSLHEAVAQQPVEGADSGSVAEVYQAGYKLGDQVIRPARVLVAA